MKKQPINSKSGALSRFFEATFSAGLLAGSVLLLSGHTSQAGSVTWRLNPASGDWNTATNWTAGGPPNGPADTATFQCSNVTGVSLSADTEVDGIVFSAGANAFTITAIPRLALTINGFGVTNNSGITQNFVTATDGAGNFGTIAFTNSATVGNLTMFTNNGGAARGETGGLTEFFDSSIAGNGTFTNNGGAVTGAFGGHTQFFNTSAAGNGTFVNNGAAARDAFGAYIDFVGASTASNGTFTNNGGTVSGANGGFTDFLNSSSAGNGVFIANGGTVSGAFGGDIGFFETSTADNATLIANGGVSGGAGGRIVFLEGAATGGTARVELFGNGLLDISFFHVAPGVTIGSLEGDGDVFLGIRELTVGSNNLSTLFSGVIQDGGGGGGSGGSLVKIGTGKLVLRHRNTYTGGSTIKHGKLMVNNRVGSGTGSGPVQVNGGSLGGKGTIVGAVTVGTGSGHGAFLSPGYQHGTGSPGALTIQSALTLNSDATYEVGVNSSSTTADEVVATGVTINSGAFFTFADIGNAALPADTTFTVINNTAATPIAGTFSNLADGSTFTNNGNAYKVNYQGGDGNDLTLKVVP